ncbi:MAG: hypothetical protein SO132_02210 [Candidatus Enteromonas sp.]|nr:hypothetical protein [Candidatus Enteromonas sp.]
MNFHFFVTYIHETLSKEVFDFIKAAAKGNNYTLTINSGDTSSLSIILDISIMKFLMLAILP